MATVQNLIDLLAEIEDKSQTVCFQYYLVEHFVMNDDDAETVPSQEVFAEAVEEVENHIWDFTWEQLAAAIGRAEDLKQQVAIGKNCRCTNCKCADKKAADN
jgi:hypothetical protein